MQEWFNLLNTRFVQLHFSEVLFKKSIYYFIRQKVSYFKKIILFEEYAKLKYKYSPFFQMANDRLQRVKNVIE